VAAVVAAAAGAAFVVMGNGRDGAGTAAPALRADALAAPVALPMHHMSRARARPHAPRTHAAKPVARSVPRTSSHRTTNRSTAAPRRPATPKAVRPAAKTTRLVPARSRPRLTVAKPQPQPVTMSDSFDGDFVDPTIWHQVTTDANVSIAEQDGRLLVTVGAGAVPGGAYDMIDVHVGTQCSFPGDFDARVDFTLLEWPSADNVFAGLSAIFAGAVVGRESGTQSGDRYTSWVGPNNGSVTLPEVSGSLRVARIDGIETTYMWHRGGWSRLAVGASRGAAVLGLQAMWADRSFPFGGQEAKVAFDNFTVTGTTPICPPGTY